ncbi:MAG: cobyrinate a,c-diamide synthase [Lachnospiraceae bacterium]|nr:cobyrinate a,c-diamide synthase [Lachnospiraceae bacterium]
MKVSRVMFAAPRSGNGKTIVTCALLQAFKNRDRQTVSFKCGPDYIDPMFHEKVIGVPAKNLDTFFTDEEQTRRIFLESLTEESFAVLEGVMGLYDGLGGIREEGSSYHLAKVTKTPVVFVVDAKGMGRSIISLLAGFLAYDKEHLIQGVLLNRISKGYYETIKPLIEKELSIPVVGFLPDKEEFHIDSRYLGLILPQDLKDIQEKLQAASEEFVKTVSVERIIKIAEDAEILSIATADRERRSGHRSHRQRRAVLPLQRKIEKDGPVIAVAKDEAFCFYYEANLSLLQENGAEIKYFSPLRDEKLPDGCHALLLGGGYPELYAERLSENVKMREAVRHAVEDGMPIVAECGGFLYLHSAMRDKEGINRDMAGVIPAECYDTGKSVRFGYVEIREKQGYFLPKGAKIKGHEFHYYESAGSGNDCIAIKPVTGKEYSCMIVDETHWMGFPHLYYPSNPSFARAFVEKAERYKEGLV